MNIVLIETSGNQRYIFATNKLRENVGASELTYRIGKEVVHRVINGKRGVKEIIATSGKALMLVDDRKIAESIVREITTVALKEMPGLTVHGAICEVKVDLTDIHEAIKNVHRKLEVIRYNMPSVEQRFLRLPFVAPCDTSGLPANRIKLYKGETDPKNISEMAYNKKKERDSGYERIKKKFPGLNFIVLEEIEKMNWIAVIHADGNGIGDIFLRFDKNSKKKEDEYLQMYSEFSDALDDCTIKAFGFALMELQNRIGETNLPVVPLILGGDDLTVLCDGQYALKFTHDFLTEFEKQTNQHEVIKTIAGNAFGVERLGICAGVAIVKPHYPFHQAYELAEQLLKSAKQVKTKVIQSDGRQLPCSALDFHILYDSTHSDLDDIRERITVDGNKTHLYAKPYVVSASEGHGSNVWLNHRKFSDLKTRIETMIKEVEGEERRLLPNGKLHEIRQSLMRGKTIADTGAGLIKNRLSEKAKKEFENLLIEGSLSLFFNESGKNFTHFLDAIEAVDFWKGFDHSNVNAVAESEVAR